MKIDYKLKDHYFSEVVTKDGRQSTNIDEFGAHQSRGSMVLGAAQRRQNCDSFSPRALRWTKKAMSAQVDQNPDPRAHS